MKKEKRGVISSNYKLKIIFRVFIGIVGVFVLVVEEKFKGIVSFLGES